MQEIVSKKIKRLNLEMEFVNYICGVPLAVSFLVLSQKMYYEKFLYVGLGFLAAISVTLIIFPYLRMRLFFSLLSPITQLKDTAEISLAKEKLLKFPRYCGILVQLQWIVGDIITQLVYYSFVPISLFGVITFILLLVFLGPINYMIHSTLADMFLANILALPIIKEIPVNVKNIRKITIFQRIGSASFAILFLPVGSLIAMYYFGTLTDPNDPFRDYLVGLIGIQTIAISYICSNLLAKILSMNTENVKQALEELKSGNLSYQMPLVDREELGFALALNFNELRDKILSVVIHLKSTSSKLNSLSLTLEKNADHVATESENQSSFAEELSASMHEFQASIAQTEKNTEAQQGMTDECALSLLDLDKEMQSSLSQAIESSELSQKAKASAEVGANLSLRAEEAIKEIQEESKAIIDYAQIISEISDQVGLLSLNASIESARAGKSGKGFQVVAREISKLGENTTANSDLISKKLKLLSSKIKKGYEQILSVTEEFKEIQKSAVKSDDSINLISNNLGRQSEIQESVKIIILQLKEQALAIYNSTTEQKLTIDESNTGLSKLTDSSDQLAQSAKNLQSLSNELKLDSNLLLEQINFFKT